MILLFAKKRSKTNDTELFADCHDNYMQDEPFHSNRTQELMSV